MTRDVESIKSAFRLQFEVDPTLDSLDQLVAGQARASDVRKFVQQLDPGSLESLGILEWSFCNALSPERADKLEKAIVEKNGSEYFELLSTAQQFVSMIQSSSEYGKVRQAFEFFARNKELGLTPFQLRRCKTVQQLEIMLSLHRQIAGGRLRQFCHEGVHLLNLGGYAVLARPGMWEVVGGISLHLAKEDADFMKAGGFFRSMEFRPETTIVSIQGTPDTKRTQREAREILGIHPANALLLLYLQMSRVLGQHRVRIRSRASHEYNESQEDSDLYRIPRNYFRLKVDSKSGMYECDAEKLDRILDKFANKNVLLANAFSFLESYLHEPIVRQDSG